MRESFETKLKSVEAKVTRLERKVKNQERQLNNLTEQLAAAKEELILSKNVESSNDHRIERPSADDLPNVSRGACSRFYSEIRNALDRSGWKGSR